MKKILIIIALFLGLYQGAFAVATQVQNFGNSAVIYLNGDNRNGLANTNGKIITLGSRLINGFFYRTFNIYNNYGTFEFTINSFARTNTTPYPSTTTPNLYVTVIEQLNSTIVLGRVGSTDSFGLFYNKQTGIITEMFSKNFDGNQTNGTLSFTFNDTSLITRQLFGGNYKEFRTFNLSDGIQTNIQSGQGEFYPSTFAVNSFQSFYVNQNNSWYTKSVLNDEVIQFYYDGVTTLSILNNISPLNNTNVPFIKLNFLDLNEYAQSEGYNTFLQTFGTSTVSNSFTGFLSYTKINTSSIYNFKFIPTPGVLGLIDYDSMNNQNISYPYAWWAGTGSTERLYYLSGGILYFDGSAGLVTTYTTSTGTTVIDTAQSVGSTNTGGFITFNNTGTGGSLSSLFANANAGSGSFLPDKLNFLFTSAITKVNTGGLNSACKPMFDVDGVFNYTKNAKSTFLINLSDGNILSLGARWNMEILGVNVIGWLYDILDWLLTMIQQIFGTILNGFFGLFSDVTGAVNIPVRNANYCFLGTNIYLQDNIKSYYSYSQKQNINVTGLNSIEMFYIFLLTIFLFVLVIKL